MESNLASFFDELSFRLEVVKDANSKLNKFLAPEFNFFKLMYIDENKMSDLIAFLLNPSERHGQGSAFLSRFLEKLLEQSRISLDISRVKVSRESHTYKILQNHRRIDILVELGAVLIAIENKLWSGEQDNQLADYSDHLSRLSNNSYIVFLTPSGHNPKTINTNKAPSGVTLVVWSYLEVATWLDECKTVCNSTRVCFFLDEFKNYILENIIQG
ncbi:PDDEXK-like family protein [Desulfovibrio sp. TomC]|uniref:PDDEXK-like family protein n=1 Tax=Desulfovibrio sp. TomC TaxID=1562888 RepID=UPI0009E38BE0|nr:PD-(D/E)XK nuclease family protein [Desulfovibrio sp. TomC]